MSGKDRVSVPGGEGRTIEPACFLGDGSYAYDSFFIKESVFVACVAFPVFGAIWMQLM